MSDLTHIRINRMNLPPVPVPSRELIDLWPTYATVSASEVTADVERFVYWDPIDGKDDVDVIFEVRMNGLEDTAGVCDIVATQPGPLCDLATGCIHAALLYEARQQHLRNQLKPLTV